MNVLICDPISPKGIEFFQKRPEFNVTVLDKRLEEKELLKIVGDTHAMVVRSETKVTRKVMEAAPHLQVVGRAGVGVDNVDVETATERGIVVMNTPGGNTISTAELTFSMLMALARRIPQAHGSMREGRWDRKAYKGMEVYRKTLGILGMGRIGSEVAKRANVFGMEVLAYDPYLSHARAKDLQVELIENLDDILPRVDFLTVHMPKTEQTTGLLNRDAFAKVKKGVRIINCARGGIVHEADLIEAIQSKQVAGAALDVYETEPLPADSPLRQVPEIIMTPHLGASTNEAQENVGIEVAEAITEFLVDRVVKNAINLPNLDSKTYEMVKPYLKLGEKLGRLIAQISPNRCDRLVIGYGGKAVDVPEDPVTRSVLKGFLEASGGKEINQVSVRTMAAARGILIEEVRSNEETDFNEWIHVAAWSEDTKTSAGGTFFGFHNHPRIVRLNGEPVEIDPSGVLLIMNNKDRPGIVGHIGSLLGNHDINIASMSLSRDKSGGQALTVVNLDSVPPPGLLEEFQQDEAISNVRIARL